MGADELLIYSAVLGSVGCLALMAFPVVAGAWQRTANHVEQYQLLRVDRTAKVFDDMFLDVKPGWLTLAYRIVPLAGGLLVYLLFNNLLFALVGAGLALMVPDMWLKMAQAHRKQRFQGQLVDALFMLSSSLRAGLSLTQAFETLESEMSPPASQEFGLMMKAHRVGLSFEEALQGLNQRMACEELNLITTAVILARGTGGDVTRIIAQLIVTIREKRKLYEKVKSLTLQGKLQAYIMSGLPVLFAVFVTGTSPGYFDIMLHDQVGRMMLGIAGGLWVVGIIVLFKVSKVDF